MTPLHLTLVERVREQLQGPRREQQIVRESLADLREALPTHLSAQLLHVAHLGLHHQRVEPAFGDWYAVCSCGWQSLPHVTRSDAFQEVCPVSAAEGERLRNLSLFRTRVAAGR
jgi:hypothetical protein